MDEDEREPDRPDPGRDRRPSARRALPPMAFRHPTEDDHRPLVHRIDGWFDRRRIRDQLPRFWFRDFASTSWLAETPDGHLAAFLVGYLSPDHPGEARIHLAATAPQLRRRGIARAIHERFVSDVTARGARLVSVLLPPDDRVAVVCYRALGFEPENGPGTQRLWGTPAYPDYDAEGQDRARFVIRLAP